MSGSDAPATNAYWGRDGLEEKILDALAAAGKNVDALTIDDLAPADQFHGGGKGATERLARLARLRWKIELDYKQLKGELGLDHYEGRSWLGWYHHTALVTAVHGFLTLERQNPNPRRPA